MPPYSALLAQARLLALQALIDALKQATDPGEIRRLAQAIFKAPETDGVAESGSEVVPETARPSHIDGSPNPAPPSLAPSKPTPRVPSLPPLALPSRKDIDHLRVLLRQRANEATAELKALVRNSPHPEDFTHILADLDLGPAP